MVSLFNLFVSNKNKPKTNTSTSAVAKQRSIDANIKDSKNRKAWHTALGKGTSDPIGKSITDSYIKSQQNQQSSSSNNESVGSNDSSVGGSDESANTSEQASEKAKEKAYKKAMASIRNMKDSNISYQYKTDYNDLWNQATVQKQKDLWEMKEEVFLYTFHDKQRHLYLTSLSIDYDKGDIMGTCQVTFPYNSKLMEYWIPGKTTFAIVGGVYDRETLFIGRVSEVNQVGMEINLVGQNIGWKFKSYMTSKFEKSLEGLTVKNAVKLIFKELGFKKGRYHIDLSGIPDINSYKMGENNTIERNGQSIENVPELKDVVKNIKSYDIDKYTKKRAETREVQKVASDYNKQKTMYSLDKVIGANKDYYPSGFRQNYSIKTEYKDENLLYSPILSKIQGSQKLEDFLVKGYSGSGESTYEDILQAIASSIDAHFFIVDTTVCFMSFNALIGNSSIVQKAVMPEIDFWQLNDESFELDINQYGFYNTVEIKYKNGTITKSYDDLVKVFGEMKISYKEPQLDYEGALVKAQAYLSAHIRDFGMELHATILCSGKITPCNFIKLKNPLTMTEGLFFIHGVSIQWSANGQPLTSDLNLRFGPENPDGLEVPEVGTSYSQSSSSAKTSTASANVSQDVKRAAQEITEGCVTESQKAYAIYDWVDKYVRYEYYTGHKYSDAQILSGKRANCYDTAYFIYRLCSAVQVRCEVWNGNYHFLDQDYGHLWNRIYYNGKMTFADTGRDSRNKIGEHGAGRYIINGSCVAKNY